MDLHLTGKRAVVTGGSQGIGKAAARQLALEGCKVVIASRTEANLQAAAASINAEAPGSVDYVTFDARDPASISSLFEQAAQKMGGIDILINNAARTGRGEDDSFGSGPVDQMVQDFEEKVGGYVLCARSAAPYMKKEGWGRIVNLSGGAGRMRGALLSHGTRNAAIRQVTVTMANALGPFGINVVCVSPGSTLTEWGMDRDREAAEKQGKTLEQYQKDVADKTLLKHTVTAADVADVIAFLCSPRAISLNAANFDVNGGTIREATY